jgi:ribonucleoside-diphosphate reductase alpha chain
MNHYGALTTHQLLYEWGNMQPRKRQKLQETRHSQTHKVEIFGEYGDIDVFITIGYYPTGEVGELFVNVGKQGSTLRGVLDSWARMVSLSIQWGVPTFEIIRKFSGISFEPYGPTSNKSIPKCSSIIDYTVKWLDLQVTHDRGQINCL